MKHYTEISQERGMLQGGRKRTQVYWRTWVERQDPHSFFQQSKPGGIFLKEVSASIQHKRKKIQAFCLFWTEI